MRKHILTVVAVVVGGLVVVVANAMATRHESIPTDFSETELRALSSFKTTYEMFVKDGLLRGVDIHETKPQATVWVDEEFLAKSEISRTNLLRTVHSYLKTRHRTDWFLNIEIRDFKTDRRIGKFTP